jgi:hypothetical protein
MGLAFFILKGKTGYDPVIGQVNGEILNDRPA